MNVTMVTKYFHFHEYHHGYKIFLLTRILPWLLNVLVHMNTMVTSNNLQKLERSCRGFKLCNVHIHTLLLLGKTKQPKENDLQEIH